MSRDALACIILAHTDPPHLKRLIAALAPFPVYLHVDSRTPRTQFAQMVAALPDRCVLLDRIATGWARFENVEAEINGYRTALAGSDAPHIALFTGSDYPLASTLEITQVLSRLRGLSIVQNFPLPHPYWGQNGGFSRLRYRHWAVRKRMLRLPIPRRLPRGMILAGGSQLKVLARDHAQAVVTAYDHNPALVSFWRRSWVADETFVPSILASSRFVPDWETEHIHAGLWWIGWEPSRSKSPPWLTAERQAAVLSRRTDPEQAMDHLFARKFSTAQSTDLLNLIDVTLRVPAVGDATPPPSLAGRARGKD